MVSARRADSDCLSCGDGVCPLDPALGLARESHHPPARRLAAEFGVRLHDAVGREADATIEAIER